MSGMKRALLYTDENGEHAVWEIAGKESRDRAYLDVFRLVDELDLQVVPMAGEQLRDMARRGNADFARAFLELHRYTLPVSFEELAVSPAPPVLLTKRVECPEALDITVDEEEKKTA